MTENAKESGKLVRCWGDGDKAMEDYHDREWGQPVHDDAKLYEYLILNTFQADLPREQVLHKREILQSVFSDYDPEKVALYDEDIVERLLQVEDMIQNKQMIKDAITNTKEFIKAQQEFETFDHYIWQFSDYRSLMEPGGVTPQTIPKSTPESDMMCEDMQNRGFKGLDSEACYAYMQNIGMANDHFDHCFMHGKKGH